MVRHDAREAARDGNVRELARRLGLDPRPTALHAAHQPPVVGAHRPHRVGVCHEVRDAKRRVRFLVGSLRDAGDALPRRVGAVARAPVQLALGVRAPQVAGVVMPHAAQRDVEFGDPRLLAAVRGARLRAAQPKSSPF